VHWLPAVPAQLEFDSQQERFFLFTTPRSALHLLPNGIRSSFLGESSLGMKLTTHLHQMPMSNKAWSCTSTSLYIIIIIFMVLCLIEHWCNFTFYLYLKLIQKYCTYFLVHDWPWLCYLGNQIDCCSVAQCWSMIIKNTVQDQLFVPILKSWHFLFGALVSVLLFALSYNMWIFD
jgi:hypothetical protein